MGNRTRPPERGPFRRPRTARLGCRGSVRRLGRRTTGGLAASGRELDFSPRAIVFLEGEEARSVFQVIEGAVMVYRLLPDGRRQVIELLRSGGLFGCTPSSIRDCSAETLVATRCLEVDRDLIDRSPAVERQIARHLASQLSGLHEHVMLLGRKSARERIASFLMGHIPDRGRQPCPGPRGERDEARLRFMMMRQEIADYLGLTIETVSRVLTSLRRRQILRMHGPEEVVVSDVCRLCRLTGSHLTRGPWCSARIGHAK